MNIQSLIKRLWRCFNAIFIFLTPAGDFFIRFWIARVFLFAGLTKLQSWPTTLALFENEYSVPLLSPHLAALLATTVELTVPVFLLLGLCGRLPAFILFFYNIIAVISYPFLFTDAGQVGFMNHFYWGVMLMVTMLHGPGKISIDSILCRISSCRDSK